jgi:hypothetical protein
MPQPFIFHFSFGAERRCIAKGSVSTGAEASLRSQTPSSDNHNIYHHLFEGEKGAAVNLGNALGK